MPSGGIIFGKRKIGSVAEYIVLAELESSVYSVRILDR